MSHLKRITDAHAELLAGKLAMQVSIPYSLAAELATKADAFDAGGHAGLTWTGEDMAAAQREGWDVFSVSGMVDYNHFSIQRLDEDERFESDAEAIWHVYRKAVRERSELHRRALLFTLVSHG